MNEIDFEECLKDSPAYRYVLSIFDSLTSVSMHLPILLFFSFSLSRFLSSSSSPRLFLHWFLSRSGVCGDRLFIDAIFAW